MLIQTFPAGPWQTNCYVISSGPTSECIIVDPGLGAAPGVADVIAEHRLHPVAILVTHGHADHMWSVFPVATGYDIPAVVHGADRYLLTNPGAAMSPETAVALPTMLGPGEVFAEPDEVVEATDGMTLHLAGLDVTVRHAPGHTGGSVMYELVDQGPIVLSGDVLFAGSVGRTDLPGGSAQDMAKSLRTVVLPMHDDTIVLPGHGPSTTIGAERVSNPYVLRIAQGMSLM